LRASPKFEAARPEVQFRVKADRRPPAQVSPQAREPNAAGPPAVAALGAEVAAVVSLAAARARRLT
jgi:hypothetical protein